MTITASNVSGLSMRSKAVSLRQRTLMNNRRRLRRRLHNQRGLRRFCQSPTRTRSEDPHCRQGAKTGTTWTPEPNVGSGDRWMLRCGHSGEVEGHAWKLARSSCDSGSRRSSRMSKKFATLWRNSHSTMSPVRVPRSARRTLTAADRTGGRRPNGNARPTSCRAASADPASPAKRPERLP